MSEMSEASARLAAFPEADERGNEFIVQPDYTLVSIALDHFSYIPTDAVVTARDECISASQDERLFYQALTRYIGTFDSAVTEPTCPLSSADVSDLRELCISDIHHASGNYSESYRQLKSCVQFQRIAGNYTTVDRLEPWVNHLRRLALLQDSPAHPANSAVALDHSAA